MSKTYKIWDASGDPFEARDREYTPGEAAEIVKDYPWAEFDADGDIVVRTYRKRATNHGPRQDFKGSDLAKRLARA